MKAETANKLSVLPDWKVRCRLIQKRDLERPRLVEHHILTEDLEGDIRKNEDELRQIAKSIREQSRKMAKTRFQVERDMMRIAEKGLVPVSLDLSPEEPRK